MSRPASALAIFVLLAIVHTWPLASNPAHLSRNDNADIVLNEWTLAWVIHEAIHDPRHLFDANIFHPERFTLAYSEAMFAERARALLSGSRDSALPAARDVPQRGVHAQLDAALASDAERPPNR